MLNNIIKINFNPKTIKRYINIKVREYCKSCKRYGYKASCPPYIESVSYYKELLPSFKYGTLIYKRCEIDNIDNWEQLGKDSSLKIHNELLKMRAELLKEGRFGVIFGAGSCKNCVKCSFPCKFPNKSIAPLEGTGVDVVKLMKKITKIELKYPVENYKYFYRIGVMFYD